MALTKHLIKRAGTLAAAAHLAAACLPAHAQVLPNIISNTAQAEWTSGGQSLSRPSNSVDIVVDRSNPQPATLEVFHFSSASGSTPGRCHRRCAAGQTGFRQSIFKAFLQDFRPIRPRSGPQQRFARANQLVLRVSAPGQNSNPGAVDSFEAEISTDTGDHERVILTETGANTAIFMALVNTKAAPPAAIQGDCVLSVRPGDQFHFDLDNAQNGNPIAGADVDILVDPFGLTFDSADGTAVDGTRVTIVDAATGQPAQVFGDDGVSSFPSTIVAGSTVTDGGGQIYAFPSGFYRFPFLRQGTYRLIITPPAPYTHPSVATPAEIALLTRPDGGQFVIADGSYGGTSR
jgi:hypothetical protein